MSNQVYDPPSANKGKKVLTGEKLINDIRMITVKIRKKKNTKMQENLTEETEVLKQTSSIAGEAGQVLWDEEKKRVEVHTFRGNGRKAEVPVTAGVEVVAEVQREKTRILLLRAHEIERKNERDSTTNDQVDQEQMRDERDTRDLHHVPTIMRVK